MTITDRSMIPIERFRNILSCLGLSQSDAYDFYWLRFAAQACVLRPEEPEKIARLIQNTAKILRDHSAWYDSMSQSMRFALAAILVQCHDDPKEFIRSQRHLGKLFREHGLRPGDGHEALAVAIMRMNSDKRRIHHQDITRFKAIYEAMKKFHWWLTGPDDFPAVAALSHIHGSAHEIANNIEGLYQFLDDAGFTVGDELQSAANLLPIIDTHVADSVSTLIALRSCLKNTGDGKIVYHYDSLLPLVMLEQKPQGIIDMCLAIHKELELSSGAHYGASNFAIAADLCFLDLVRFDKNLESKQDPIATQKMLHNIHTFHIMSAACTSRFSLSNEGTFPEWQWAHL